MKEEKKIKSIDARERARKLLKLLNKEEIGQFLKAVKDDFGCQWNDDFDYEGIFRELYKLLQEKYTREQIDEML